MKLLIVLLAVLAGVWLWKRGRRLSQPPRPRQGAALPMVRCQRCGMHVPDNEVVTGRAGALLQRRPPARIRGRLMARDNQRERHPPRFAASQAPGASLPPALMPLAGLLGDADGAGGFARLWTAFMSARLLIGLAILSLHMGLSLFGRPTSGWLLGWCAAYVVLAAAVRVMARPSAPGRPFDPQWLPTVGVDLMFFAMLQLQPSLAPINYTPLLALPVLMAAIMGSRPLALGTASLVTLLLLGHAAWTTSTAAAVNAADLAQAGLTGAALLLLALLTNQMASRLAREETVARRNRVEAQVQALVNNLVVESLADGVLVVDSDYLVRTANPAAHLMLGADQEVTPHLFSLRDNPAWLQLMHIAQLTFADSPVDAADVILYHDDRMTSRLQVRTQRTPPIGDSGVSLCVMFLQDLREMEARLRTEKLASMGRMSAAVAHEIRNPLAAISQANALLDEDLSDPALRRLTGMVRQNAERLQHIVEDVLDIARVQGQADAAQLHTLALDDEAAAFGAEWVQQHAAGPRLRLALNAPGVQVQFAREHLRRILVNLLDNAARYASGRDGAIQVETHAVRHGPVMLTVWSDGPAIEPTVRRHLFEPFFSSESRSSGLGLFICRELCERHGATAGYERSTRDQGGQVIEGNEFFVSFRRAHSGHSTFNIEDTALP
ncbi:ATP-binding protein [Ottowia testudinis]|uniref:histidine kinase n=1 Tax=Ottowia testudinis TaxID=2816950 RepID=A0A975CFV7_9BURK|nr:ATP-binding protein [Ottowia testudinis]QTD44799.1 PAS domain-containing protein [Ottowia testudinis]